MEGVAQLLWERATDQRVIEVEVREFGELGELRGERATDRRVLKEEHGELSELREL